MYKSRFNNEKIVVILGDNEVGKTCILKQFAKNKFITKYIPTMGVDFYTKEYKINEKIINFCLWDTNGEEKNTQILPYNIYLSTNAFIIVCSYVSISSSSNIPDWINLIKKYLNKNNRLLNNIPENIPIFILINKVDIKEKYFSKENIQSFVKDSVLDVKIMETSAKQPENIDNLFITISRKLLGLNDKIDGELIDESFATQNSFNNINEVRKKCPKCC